MEPQMDTDTHRFLSDKNETILSSFLSDFVCVHLCKSVAKISYFRDFFVFVRG